MSESRNNGESRYSVAYNIPMSGESRSSESRTSYYVPRESVNTSRVTSKLTSKSKYNDLASIDALIERLEIKEPVISRNDKVNIALEERKRKLEELKRLRKGIEQQNDEEIIQEIFSDTDELEDAIDQLKKLVKKPTSSATPYFRRNCNFSSESRGEN